MKKAWSEWVLPAVALIMFGVMIGIGISGFILGYAGAEGSDGFIHECWVLCQPDSGVYVRRRPGTQSEAVAIVSCGTSLRTYQWSWRRRKRKDGFVSGISHGRSRRR